MELKYQKHSDTSREAAISVLESATTLRARVYRAIRDWGELTDEEIQGICRMNPSTQRPRRIELVERGIVRDSGKRRATKSGRSAVLWQLTS